MGAAIGSVPVVNSKGSLWYDVWDWGGRPGDTNGIDQVLETIRADILAHNKTPGKSTPAIIYFRDSPDPWYVTRPFFVDMDDVEIQGASPRSTRLETTGLTVAPPLIFGVARQPALKGINASLRPDNWVDLYGVLDTTAASAPGQRWGLHTRDNAYMTFMASPLSIGLPTTGWKTVSKLTIDFCIDPGDGKAIADGFILGMNRDAAARAHPWSIRTYFGSYDLRLAVRENGDVNTPIIDCLYRIPAALGKQHVSIQIDLTGNSSPVQAWVNNKEVKVNSGGSVLTGLKNPQFIYNEFSPFNMGHDGVFSRYTHAGTNLGFYGLRLSSELRWASDGSGNQIDRWTSSSTITDYDRYFNLSALINGQKNLIGFLRLLDPPLGSSGCVADGKLITVQSGPPGGEQRTPGLFLESAPMFYPFARNAVRRMSVASRGVYSQAIAVGSIYYIEFTDIRAEGGSHGIGSIPFNANYTITAKNCYFSGFDSGYFGYSQILIMDNAVFAPSHAPTFVRMHSSVSTLSNLIFGSNYYTENSLKFHDCGSSSYGGVITLNNINADSESGDGPTEACIYCENHAAAPTQLDIRNLTVGVMADSAAVVKLVGKRQFPDVGYNYYRAAMKLDGMQMFGKNHRACVLADSPIWHGDIKNLTYVGYDDSQDTVPAVGYTTPDNRGSLISHHTHYSQPPRNGTWIAGSHMIEVRNPANGHYYTLRCAQTGEYGTSTPPLWIGCDRQELVEESMANYILDHCYISATLN